METASLRIKFTPLFNNALQNGSKCCLEIVPEVSYVQNLDKISWKQENDLIEYTIPMTYKVILKKRDNQKDFKGVFAFDELQLDKTYHSCVDLLPPSSMTAFEFASGDVTRIISDTYIFGKISAKIDDDKPKFNNHVPINDQVVDENNTIIELPIEKKTTEKQTVTIVNAKPKDKHNIANKEHVLCETNKYCLVEKKSKNKDTNTENIQSGSKIIETQCVDTTTELSGRIDDSKRKMSLSPIFSFNTYHNQFPVTAEEPKLNFVVNFATQRKTINDFSETLSYKLPTRIEKLLDITTIDVENGGSMESVFKARIRELPEARVAKFLKKMETEIMPLKVMLNNIVQKCSRLGLNDKNKLISRNLVLYKTLPNRNNQIQKHSRTEKQIKSNRVVYSIVFEEFTGPVVMDNDSVVEQIVKSLSFEVQAVPQDNVLQLTTTTKAAPLNVKIRVRKKEEAVFRNGVISLPKPNQPESGVPERVRLVSSDQTLMSFNIVMEADFDKPPKKHRGIMGMFKPRSQPNDEHYAYSPNTVTYQAKLVNKDSKSDGALMKFTLFKNVDYENSATKKKDFFGRYKPGGCLDPPFAEDRLPYLPAIVDIQSTSKNVSKSERRTSSIFSNKIFNKKKKSVDVETFDNNVIPTAVKASIVQLHQSESQKSYSNNSILTYPPTLNSSDQQQEKRGSSTTDQSKFSFNEQSGSFYIVPKKQNILLEKNNHVKKEYEKNIMKISETLDRNPRDSIDLNTTKSVTTQHVSELADSHNIKEINPLKSVVPESIDFMIPVPITSQINQVENDTLFKESHEDSGFSTIKLNSTSSNALKINTICNGNRDSLLQTDKSDCDKNKAMDKIFISEQMFDNKLATKSIDTLNLKYEIAKAHPNDPLLNKRKSSDKITEYAPLQIINKEDDNLQYLFKNQNNPTISETNFQQEPELDNETNKNNKILCDVKDIKKLNQVPNISILNNDDVPNEPGMPDIIIPKNIIDNCNLLDNINPSLESIINNNFIGTVTNEINSTKEPNMIYISSITELKAAADQFKDVCSDQREEVFGLVAEPTSKISISINSHTQPEQQNLIEISKLALIRSAEDENIKDMLSFGLQDSIKSSKKSLIESDQKNKASIEDASTGNQESLHLDQQILELASESSPKTSYSSNSHIQPEQKQVQEIINLPYIRSAEDEKTKDTLGFVPHDSKQDLEIEQKSKIKRTSNSLKKIQGNIITNIEAIADDNKDSLNLLRQEGTLKLEIESTSITSKPINSLVLSKQQISNTISKLDQIKAAEDENIKKVLGFGQKDSNPEQTIERTSRITHSSNSFMETEQNKNNNIVEEAMKQTGTEENKDDFNLHQQDIMLELTTKTSKDSTHSSIQSEQNITETHELSRTEVVDDGIKIPSGFETPTDPLRIKTYSSNSINTSNQKTTASFHEFTKSPFENNEYIKIVLSNDELKTPLLLKNGNAVELTNKIDLNSEIVIVNSLENEDSNNYGDKNILVHEYENLNYKENNEQDLFKPELENGTHSRSGRISYSYNSIKSYMKDDKMSQNLNELITDLDENKNSFIPSEEVPNNENPKNDSRKMDTPNEIIEDKIESLNILKDKQRTTKDKPNTYITKITHDDFENSNSLGDDSKISKTTILNRPGINQKNKYIEHKTDDEVTTSFESARERKGDIFLNLAIQSYVDDMNQTIVKSFDTESVPVRYPQDFIKITKRYLKTDEKIEIPLDSNNYMDIQIKNSNLGKTSNVTNKPPNLETEQYTLSNNIQYISTRNGIIAEDIKRTLEVVYEKELLPLRNDISELKDNIKMLSEQHKLVTSVFVKKARSTKIIPVYRKCSCSRR